MLICSLEMCLDSAEVFGGAFFYFLICQEPPGMAGAPPPPGFRGDGGGGGGGAGGVPAQHVGVTSLLPPTEAGGSRSPSTELPPLCFSILISRPVSPPAAPAGMPRGGSDYC